MIARYTRPELRELWSESTKFEVWRDVEVALVEVLEENGTAEAGAADALRAQPVPTAARVAELERTTDHDVIAFLTALADGMGPSRKWIHYGMTSTDLVDTAQAIRLRRSVEVIATGLDAVLDRTRALALRYQRTPMVGRTHGVHAEPMTLGLKFLSWYAAFDRDRERLSRANEALRVGKLSGAVGTCPHHSPADEARILARLGLEPDPVATQVLARDRHAELMSALAILGANVERAATEIRHLHRTEVREVCEGFAPGQKGSSAMPHKKNPITCERLTGLARILRGYLVPALENVALWHERDISHSSVERVILPDAICLTDYMLDKLATVLDRLEVHEDTMRSTLDGYGGLVFSGHVLLSLTRALDDRDAAYAIVQRHALACWTEGGSLLARLQGDPEVTAVIDEATLARHFDLDHVLRNVDAIFERTLR
jgi:adenylosuccinate lyase